MVNPNPNVALDPRRIEALGPAERILATLTSFTDHMVHNRPGLVVPDASSPIGVRWYEATWKAEDEGRVVYRKIRQGRRITMQRMGVMADTGQIRERGREVGRWQAPGLFPEVAVHLYRQVAAIYRLDNEFVAHWASWQLAQENRDLKVVLAAFLLVQPRKGAPEREGDAVLFYDEDYRAVGEAMCLLRRKDKRDLSPKLLLRVGQLLKLPSIAGINRELGFGGSERRPMMGRYEKVVGRWLRFRERNPQLLQGLVRAGLRSTVRALARTAGYKPQSAEFFRVLGWRQKANAHRSIGLDLTIERSDWQGLDEAAICQRITDERPSFKRITAQLPHGQELTAAIMAASVLAGCLSDRDLVIYTPTLEGLGLLGEEPAVAPVKARWQAALQQAEDQRARTIAARVRDKKVVEQLEDAADKALEKAVEKVVRGIAVYLFVDISGSMQGAIEEAKGYLTQLLAGFPLAALRVAVFNTRGREVTIKHASRKGIEAAFRGISAGGGTDYGAGVRALQKYRPTADEDALFLFVGDQMASRFTQAVRDSRLAPVAFGMLQVGTAGRWDAVTGTATELGIPCFPISTRMFGDAYAVPQILRNLIASTPVGKGRTSPAARTALVETILATPILRPPLWARAG